LEWDGVKNGNGGVAFLVGVETSSVLRIRDGEFETAAAIKFTVEGYGAGTTAGVYYAQVPIGDSIGVDNYVVQMATGVSVTLDGTGASGVRGVYVFGGAFTMDGGTISNFIINNTSDYSSSGVVVESGAFTMNGGGPSQTIPPKLIPAG
jgi:hypothetical protein